MKKNGFIRTMLMCLIFVGILAGSAYAYAGRSPFGYTGVKAGGWVNVADPKSHNNANGNRAYFNASYVDNNSSGTVNFYLRKQLTSEVATEYMCVAGIPQVYQPKYKFTKASDYEGKVFFLCAMQTGNGPVTISGEWEP